MEYTVFGRTGRRVSRLGFGGAPAGLTNYLGEYNPEDPRQRDPVIEAILEAFRLGINYFDTARAYGDGASECIFGEALEGVPNESLFLATKVGSWADYIIREELEQSLKNLRRDSIDLLQIHGTHYSTEHENRIFRKGGFLDQLEALKSEGLIRHIGVTCESICPVMFRMIESGRFDSIQMCYNLMFQHPYDPGWKSGCFYDCKEKNMGIAVMRSTTSGILQKWIQAVNPDNQFDYTPALIQFQLSCPLVDVALVGMRSPERVRQNVTLVERGPGRVVIEELFKRYL